MAPSAFIARLPEEVRAMVETLPAQELEAFTHLASYSPGSQGPGKSKSKSKGPKVGGKKSKESHERYVGCDCWDCYTKFWEMWDSSPNKGVIDKALEALELNDGTARRYPWSMGKRRKGKEKVSRGAKEKKEQRCVGNVDQEGKAQQVAEEVVVMLAEEMTEEETCSASSVVGEAMRREKVKAERPPKSKQVAPVDFKAEDESDELLLKPIVIPTPGTEELSPSKTGWKSASDAAGFVCDKLLWMWNPRLRRRQ